MARGPKIRLTGHQIVAQNLATMTKRAEKAAEAGIYALGWEIMNNSKRRTPVDDGVLRGSGYVTLPQKAGRASIVEIGFGGPAAKYALKQHEETEYNHDVGEAKYLENAINALKANASKIVSAEGKAHMAKPSRIGKLGPVTPNEGPTE